MQQQERLHKTPVSSKKDNRLNEKGQHSQQSTPFALIDQSSKGQRLSAVDEEAEKQGLAPNMALSDALTLCPSLVTRRAVPQKDTRRLSQLASWCERYSPLSNVYDDNSLWIDVTGATHLFKDEQSLLAKISRDFYRQGYTANLALASSFAAAFALSHFSSAHFTLEDMVFGDSSRFPVIPPKSSFEQLQKHLSLLPVKALRLENNTSSLLHRLGLMTIGQLMELPRDSLKRRFPSPKQAKAVLLRLDQILGLRHEPLVPLTPPVLFSSRLRFAEALFSTQALEQALDHLIKEITRQLEHQNHGARTLTFTLWRSDGSTSHIKIGTAQPCRDKAHLFNLFKEKLNHIEPGFGIDVIALFVDRAEPLPTRQVTLAGKHSSHGSASPDVLIDRLSNHIGAEKIGYLRARQSHIPERAQELTSTPPPPKTAVENLHSIAPDNTNTPSAPPINDRPFLLLDPPESIEVMAALPDDPPVAFTWRRVTRKVVASNGPERITPEWWLELGQKDSRPRDYYKVSAREGGTFWLYRNGLYPGSHSQGDEEHRSLPQWYMHGFFG